MILGNYWVNLSQGELVNQVTRVVWQLSIEEKTVLTHLIRHKGNIVPTALLAKSLSPEQAELSEEAVRSAIFRLRSFLGPKNNYLIETVKGRGFRLYVGMKRKQKPASNGLSRFVYSLARAVPVVVIAVLMVAAIGIWQQVNQLSETVDVAQHYDLIDTTKANGSVLDIYTSDGFLRYDQHVQEIVADLRSSFLVCKRFYIPDIDIKINSALMGVEVKVSGKNGDVFYFRNLRITDLANYDHDINLDWFKLESLCY